ncbi:MAG TPA: rubredoxin [Chitinophagaceae bacterium]|nr:rubredoxin [Chitinophagaceae bacterium]
MRHAYQFKVNFTGGIVSPGYLYTLLQSLQDAGLTEVRFGLRQQLLIDVTAKAYNAVEASLDAAQIEYEINEDKHPNISSSYPAAEIFIRQTWLSEGVYKDVFNLFDYKPSLKINITDSNQTFTPYFTGNLNWIASAHNHFWWLVIRFPGTNTLFYWKDLIYTNDLANLSEIIERVISANSSSCPDNNQADGDLLYDSIRKKWSFTSKPVTEKLVMPSFKLPYYEGYNAYGNKSWLGIYRRDELFEINFLKDVCRICLETKSGELYTTPWKSIIIKGIEEKRRPLWGFILGKHRINVRHASNELNWQVEDGNNEGLNIKRQVIRQFDKEDVRTFGLCFAVKTQPKSGVFGSVLVRRQFTVIRGKLKALEKYDILYTADFNPNSKEYILFRNNVDKEHLGTYLVALCKYYYAKEDENELLPGSSYTDTAGGKEEVKRIYYQCRHCLTVYDETLGEPGRSIGPGTLFDALPETWCCDLCEAPKTDYTRKEISQPGLHSV